MPRDLPRTAAHASAAHARAAHAQARLLRRLVLRASETAFGRAYRFGEIARADDVVGAFRARVPLQEYESLREAFDATRAGVPDVLWPGHARHFAVSSGTASAGKVLPRSREHLVQDARFSVRVGMRYLAASGRGAFLGGRHLSIPGRTEPDPLQPGAVVGEVSGLVAEAAPAFFRRFYQAVPNEIAFLPDWEAKLDAIAAATESQDVRLIAMVPSWARALFGRVRAAHARRTGRHVDTIGEVWPNLQVFVSGGVALSSYRAPLADEIGRAVDFVETYGASEGFFSYQDDLADPAMRLDVRNGVFFEFVPFERLGEPDPPRFSIGEVEVGVRYAPFVSTLSGLWAYGVGDVVRFTHLDPPRLLIVGRTREVLDRYGEAVHGEEARAAFEAACAATGARGADFHVSPVVRGGVPGHRWLCEFAAAPDDAGRFADVLDRHLVAINRHYAIRREAGAFRPPEVVALPEGHFLRWMQATRSRVGAQSKVPRLRDDGEVADALLALLGGAVVGAEGAQEGVN